MTLLEVVDRAAAKVGERFASQPELERELRGTIAKTYHGLASWEKAEAQYRAILDSRQRVAGGPEIYRTLSELAHIIRHRGQSGGDALAMAETAAHGLERLLGPDHPDTLASMNILAMGCQAAGKFDLALPLFEETLRLRTAKLGPSHPDTLNSMNNLAQGCNAAGQRDQAMEILEMAYPRMKTTLGPNHPYTLRCMHNLAAGYLNAGKLDLGLPLIEETVRLMKTRVGPHHFETLTAMNTLAHGYWMGRNIQPFTAAVGGILDADNVKARTKPSRYAPVDPQPGPRDGRRQKPGQG